MQRLALRNELTKVVDDLQPDDGVQVWRVAPSATELPDAAGPLLCNPGETVNPWVGNPTIARNNYLDKFRTPVLSQLDAFIRGISSLQSPIMESVQAIALRTFDRPEYRSVSEKALVLASDMIQNTATYSQLHAIEPFDKFERSLASKKLAPHLAGVRVTLLYIQRPLAPSYKQHIEFWQRYFLSAGASLERVIPVAGMSH